MPDYVAKPVSHPLAAVVSLPGSKSITNRALIASALADGTSVLQNVLLAEDSRLMIGALEALGVRLTLDEPGLAIEVSGCRGLIPYTEAELDCGNAGTVMRFCTALAATGQGPVRLDGSARMRQRPIAPLVDGLRALGSGVEYHEQEGFPPLTVHGRGIRGGRVVLPAIESSQFLSALLLAAPCASGDVYVEVPRAVPSEPYLKMTTALMERFGVVVLDDAREGRTAVRWIVAAPQRYLATSLRVEPDASNATYFLAAPAIAGGWLTVRGLGPESIQGDVRFVDVLELMGCRVERRSGELTVHAPGPGQRLRGVDVDLNAMPDTVPTLAVLALFADAPTTIRNVAGLRIKETDRLAALHCELTKLGAHVDERADGLTIHPTRPIRRATLDTYDDHRMAMSFTLAGLGCPGLTLRNPECCGKTFPDFFERFEHAARPGGPPGGLGS